MSTPLLPTQLRASLIRNGCCWRTSTPARRSTTSAARWAVALPVRLIPLLCPHCASAHTCSADLHAPHSWSLAHVRSPALQREFSSVVDSLGDALHFMKVVGADRADGVRGSLESVDYFTR